MNSQTDFLAVFKGSFSVIPSWMLKNGYVTVTDDPYSYSESSGYGSSSPYGSSGHNDSFSFVGDNMLVESPWAKLYVFDQNSTKTASDTGSNPESSYWSNSVQNEHNTYFDFTDVFGNHLQGSLVEKADKANGGYSTMASEKGLSSDLLAPAGSDYWWSNTTSKSVNVHGIVGGAEVNISGTGGTYDNGYSFQNGYGSSNWGNHSGGSAGIHIEVSGNAYDVFSALGTIRGDSTILQMIMGGPDNCSLPSLNDGHDVPVLTIDTSHQGMMLG